MFCECFQMIWIHYLMREVVSNGEQKILTLNQLISRCVFNWCICEFLKLLLFTGKIDSTIDTFLHSPDRFSCLCWRETISHHFSRSYLLSRHWSEALNFLLASNLTGTNVNRVTWLQNIRFLFLHRILAFATNNNEEFRKCFRLKQSCLEILNLASRCQK